jgi:hypothetical protein
MREFDPSVSSYADLLSVRLPKKPEKGPEIRLFVHSVLSPNSWFAEVEVQMAESLRPYPQIFPFC